MNRESTIRALLFTGAFVVISAVHGCASSGATRQRGAAAADGAELPAISVEEARKLLLRRGYVYLDVRTPSEFVAGRPKGAINVPVFFLDPATGERVENKDFLSVVEAHIRKNAQVIVGCQTGGRSAVAQRKLYEDGYENTYNMLGGFGGKRDSEGHVVHQGWAQLGYPVEKGPARSAGYEDLKKRAGR